MYDDPNELGSPREQQLPVLGAGEQSPIQTDSLQRLTHHTDLCFRYGNWRSEISEMLDQPLETLLELNQYAFYHAGIMQ
jgi:hypothetical protein